MSQMLFNHDTEHTLRAVAVLINSDRVDGERLGDLAALDEYLDSFGWTGRRDHDAAELAAVHRLRDRLGRIWEAADDEARAVGGVNALLSDTRAAPWLTRHPEMPEWHLHLASIHDPLWQRMGAEMAMALADLIRSGELRRLKICAAPTVRRCWSTCRATGPANSATQATAATANMSPPTGSAAPTSDLSPPGPWLRSPGGS